MTDLKMLTDEELQNVNGGGNTYHFSQYKPNGYSFYFTSDTNMVLKITGIIKYIDNEHGYLYSLDEYNKGVYKRRYSMDYSDDEIDVLVSTFGKPE